MVWSEVSVSVAEDDHHLAGDAARRLSGVRRKINCVVIGNNALLSGELRHEDLEHCWRIALLNERLEQDARSFRRTAITELIS